MFCAGFLGQQSVVKASPALYEQVDFMVEFTVVHVPVGQRSTGSWGELGSVIWSGHQSDAWPWPWPWDHRVQMPSMSSP